jgi:peptide/nickel transport system permease protein
VTAKTPSAEEPVQAPPQQPFLRFLTFFLQMAQYPLALVGMILVFGYLILSLIGPEIAPYPFEKIIRGTDIGLEDRRAQKSQPPSEQFLMGTDQRGRDIFSRMLWGARVTIGLPLVATSLAVSLGTFVGLLTGYIGGWVDELISRTLDSLLSIPALVLALVMFSTIVPVLSTSENPIVVAVGANNISLIIVIVLLYVPIVTRVVRSATLSVRASGYIEAAKLQGESTLYIMFREILPSVLPALFVEASLRFSYAVFLVASLGFLGLGVQPPSPEWGRMVLDARSRINNEPWELWFPVLGIAILIISINLMSDGLRRSFHRELES